MQYSRNFIDILEEMVSILNLDMEIISVISSVGDVHTLRVCDVKHAQANYTVYIDEVSYKINSVDSTNKIIVVEGTGTPTVTYFELYRPKFYHGTPREISTDIGKVDHTNNVTPMIWLNEIYEEEFGLDTLNPIDREITPSIYALGKRPDDKKASDLKELYIEPMRRLMENFIDTLLSQTQLFDMTEYETKLTNYAKFGVYVNNSGVPDNLFAMPLSGVSNSGKIKILAKEECDDEKCKTENGIITEDGDDFSGEDITDTLIQEP